MKKLTIYLSAIILLLLTISCLKEGELKQPYKGYQPADISDGWVLSDPQSENIDPIALDQIYKDVYADDEMWMTKSLLVFRNGKLVAESYLKTDEDRTRRDAIWSCTKQINGIITGIAIDQGYVNSVTDSIGVYLPDNISRHPDKAGITLEMLLMMKSGSSFDNGTQSDIFREHKTDNSIEYVLGLPLAHEPGTTYWYNDGDPQLVSAIINVATGKTLADYGKEVFLDKIGFTNYEWYDYSDGLTLGAFGILTTPREMAKVAQCVLDGGKWNNEQVIPEAWVATMLTSMTQTDYLSWFGYYWWSIPDKSYHYMAGHGGQYAFLLHEKDLMVVVTSLVQVDDDVNIPLEKIVDIVDRVVAAAE